MDSGIKPCKVMRKNAKLVGDMDRISSLQNELLGEILSFLPTKEAVATSVLSKRWRHVFTWITSLDFDHSPISHCSKRPHLLESFAIFKSFVDSVLRACKSENITKFSLKYGKKQRIGFHRCERDCFPDLTYTHINKWICSTLTGHGVRELDLCVNVTKPGKLPAEIFACRTLEVLKLDMNLDLEVPIISFCLPNLKVFHLHVEFILDWESITRLVASCPCLVDLVVKSCWDTLKLINLSAPLSLQRLVLVNSYINNEINRDIFLDIPNVQYLEFRDLLPFSHSVTSLNALIEARIRIRSAVSIPELACQQMHSLLRTFSNVPRLSLLASSIQLLHDGESKHKLPIFHRLNQLQLGFNGLTQWRKVLLEFLNCSPCLESLTFPHGISTTGYPAGIVVHDEIIARSETQYWGMAQAIPSCFKSSLKQIWIEHYHGLERELELVKYFLRSALVLESLIIVCDDESSLTEADKLLLQSTLQMLPRGSTTCSIKVR